MDEEVKKEENPFIQPSVEEMLASSEVVSEPKAGSGEPEEGTEEPKEQSSDEPTTKEEPQEPDVTAEEEPEEEGLTEERFGELVQKFPELKEYRDSFNNYNTWEKKLRQKSQAISYLKKLQEESPEKIELLVNKISPYMYGKEELPQAPSELVDGIMEKVELSDLKFVDDDEFEIQVGREKLKPIVRNAIENALNTAVPEMAALRSKLSELSKERDELDSNYKASMMRQGEMEMEQLASKHQMLNVKRLEDETLLEAVNRIQEAGEDHPEFNKLSKWSAIGNEAQARGWTLDKAFKSLYGEDERKTIEENLKKETAAKNQKTTTQEDTDGEKLKELEDWEELGISNSHEHAIDVMFRKQGL